MSNFGCSTLTTILKSCENNMGGIREIYIWDMLDVDTANSTFNPATGVWTAYALFQAPAALLPIAYEFTRNSSNYIEEATIDLVAGSTFLRATLTLMFARREAAKSVSLQLLGEGQRYLGAMVLDSNGLYWLFQDLQISATGEGSGTARADGSKYSVTLIGETTQYAGLVEDTSGSGPIGAGNAEDLITLGAF